RPAGHHPALQPRPGTPRPPPPRAVLLAAPALEDPAPSEGGSEGGVSPPGSRARPRAAGGSPPPPERRWGDRLARGPAFAGETGGRPPRQPPGRGCGGAPARSRDRRLPPRAAPSSGGART